MQRDPFALGAGRLPRLLSGRRGVRVGATVMDTQALAKQIRDALNGWKSTYSEASLALDALVARVAELDGALRESLKKSDRLESKVAELEQQLAAAREELREDFEHVEGEPLSETAAVATTSFRFARHRAEAAEARAQALTDALEFYANDPTGYAARAIAALAAHGQQEPAA